MFVLTLRSVTVAPVTTAPCGSVTVPLKSADATPDCAKAAHDARRRTSAVEITRRRQRTEIVMSLSPYFIRTYRKVCSRYTNRYTNPGESARNGFGRLRETEEGRWDRVNREPSALSSASGRGPEGLVDDARVRPPSVGIDDGDDVAADDRLGRGDLDPRGRLARRGPAVDRLAVD